LYRAIRDKNLCYFCDSIYKMKKITVLYIAILIVVGACNKSKNESIKDFFYMQTNGANLPVFVEGNKQSQTIIIMLHGGPGGDAQVYNTGMPTFSDPLEKEFIMVYYDQRGSGNANGKYSSSILNVDEHVQDLDKLITLLENKYGANNSIFLMGHSWGGTLGSAYLLDTERQKRISGWIEVDGAHNFNGTPEVIATLILIGEEQIKLGNNNEKWGKITEYAYSVDPLYPSDQDISKLNSFGFEGEQLLQEDDVIGIENESKVARGQLAYAFFSSHNLVMATSNLYSTNLTMFQEIKNLDYTPLLHQITIPSLLLWGRYDLVVPAFLGQQAFDAIGSTNKRYVEFLYSGHSPMINQTTEFVNEVISFVNKHN
jgi:proline iminopeptidase